MENLLVKIESIKNTTADSKTFYLDPGTTPLVYQAGQFVTLLLRTNGKEIRRSYSFSSTPAIDKKPFVTIKRVENGYVSRYIFNHIQAGDSIEIIPPSGRFLLNGAETRHHFFIAAGSGITPIFSLIKKALYLTEETSVTLLYQNTNEKTTMFRDELLALEQTFANRFKMIDLLSRPYEHMHHPQRLNNALLEYLVQRYKTNLGVHFYLCGPKGFMQMAMFTLRLMGYSDRQISKENFIVDVVPPPPFKVDPTPRNVVIQYKGTEHTLKVAWPHNILEAALHQNLKLPYSCRGGRCSACAAICKKGSVKMSINEVLTENDLDKGLVLTCVGYAETDIELNFDYSL